MEWSAVPFHPLLWAGLDVAVCAALIRPAMPWRNVLIVLLFAPAWGAYFMPEPWRYLVPAGVVIAQFVLTIPAIDLGQFRARHHSTRGQWRDFDLREQA